MARICHLIARKALILPAIAGFLNRIAHTRVTECSLLHHKCGISPTHSVQERDTHRGLAILGRFIRRARRSPGCARREIWSVAISIDFKTDWFSAALLAAAIGLFCPARALAIQ